MTRFTRRTYRVARKRALEEIRNAREYLRIASRFTGRAYTDAIIDYYFAEDKARRIVARGRREKGMWHV